MCFNKLLVPLALAMLFNSAGVVSGELSDVSTEPTDCYKMAWNGQVTSGLAASLCSGTTDASKTLVCFVKAYGHPDEDGLGLPMGLAVKLCKSNSEPLQ